MPADRVLPVLTKALQIAAAVLVLALVFRGGPFAPDLSVTPEKMQYDFGR